MSTTTDTELFNAAAYEIPFPQADGKEVTDLVLRLGGTLKLSRHDPDHVALIESLTLGRHIELNVLASVDSKGQSVRHDGETEVVTHSVGLRLHSATAA